MLVKRKAPRRKAVLRSNSQGLTPAVQKKLAEAIESTGGIACYSGSHPRGYLDKLVPEYHQGDNNKKCKLRHKVKNWASLSPDEYQNILNQLGVLAAVGRSSPPKTNTTEAENHVLPPPTSTPSTTEQPVSGALTPGELKPSPASNTKQPVSAFTSPTIKSIKKQGFPPRSPPIMPRGRSSTTGPTGRLDSDDMNYGARYIEKLLQQNNTGK